MSAGELFRIGRPLLLLETPVQFTALIGIRFGCVYSCADQSDESESSSFFPDVSTLSIVGIIKQTMCQLMRRDARRQY